MKTATATDAGAFGPLLQSFRLRLESERDRVCREIRDYPKPIPRCDAQFNHLLEQRDSMVRELQRLEGVANAKSAVEASRLVAVLIDESNLSDSLKRELRSIASTPQPDPALR